MSPKPKASAMSPLETLIDAHTDLGLSCARIARDDEQPWKTRNVFEANAWVIYEQVKALRTQDLAHVPDVYVDMALSEVAEANVACQKALKADSADKEMQGALAAIETSQAIDSVDGVLGKKAP